MGMYTAKKFVYYSFFSCCVYDVIVVLRVQMGLSLP